MGFLLPFSPGGNKRHYTREEIWYEAGAMILASSGVCNLGDWSMLRKDHYSYVFQCIESRKIVLNNMIKSKTEADFLPLKCNIWTYWCHITSSNQDQTQLKTLMNVFGMPFLAVEEDETEVKKLSRKILDISMVGSKNNEFSTIPVTDFKEFLSIINSRSLILSEAATKLIHDFFVVMRKERPECLSAGAIKTITSLAEAHARLSLRGEITYDDVIAVLYLYHMSISRLFGEALINFKVPHLPKSESLHKTIHDNINHFQVSLKKYLENYLFL